MLDCESWAADFGISFFLPLLEAQNSRQMFLRFCLLLHFILLFLWFMLCVVATLDAGFRFFSLGFPCFIIWFEAQTPCQYFEPTPAVSLIVFHVVKVITRSIVVCLTFVTVISELCINSPLGSPCCPCMFDVQERSQILSRICSLCVSLP